jgi:hypothetical protein
VESVYSAVRPESLYETDTLCLYRVKLRWSDLKFSFVLWRLLPYSQPAGRLQWLNVFRVFPSTSRKWYIPNFNPEFDLFILHHSYPFSMAQKANWDLRCLIVDISISHTVRHTHRVGLLWTRDQLVAEASTYTTHKKKHKRWTSMPSDSNPRSKQSADAEVRLRLHGHREWPHHS